MIKKSLFSFCTLVFSFTLFAESNEDLDFFNFEASRENIIDERQNYFLTSTDYSIAPKVNPVTGEYSEEEIDLLVAGSEPLSVRRFYNSGAPADPRYANWRYNPESFLAGNFEWVGQEIFAAIGEANGGISSLKRSAENYTTFDFEVPKSLALFSSSGQSHPLNTKIDYWKYGDPKDKNRHEYRGTIVDGSGRQRSFVSPMHRWIYYVHWREKKGNWLAGSERLWRIYPNTWTPFPIPIYEERLPNGNILSYTYARWKKEERNYPLPRLLESITAYNADKSKVLGSISFEYPRAKHEEVAGIRVTGSDGRYAFMQHSRKSPITLSSAIKPGQPFTTYHSQGNTLNRIEKPGGRAIATEYNAEGKVCAQYAPVGKNEEMCPIGRYEYLDKATIFLDAEDNKTLYHYDEDKKITAIEKYLVDALYRIDRFTWDPATGNLLSKTIEDPSGRILEITEYEYDKNQNAISEKMGNTKEKLTLTRTFSEDGFNLKLTETDREGRLVRYCYVPNTNLLASEFTFEGNTIKKRIFHFYDDCAICIKTLIDDGSTEDPYNLQEVSYRKITQINPKQAAPCFGLPEIVEEKTINSSRQEILISKIAYTYAPSGKILQEDHFDAEGNFRYSLQNTYDQLERLVSSTDPLGATTFFTYDPNHNLTSIKGPKPDQYREIAYDKANRPIRITSWQTDGSLLIIEKKYDKLGRLIEEIDACKNSTYFDYDALSRLIAIHHPDGACEKKEYDLLGNLIKESDPEGYETTKTYNAFHQPLSIRYPDHGEECFTYNSTGTLHSHLDKNGATKLYTYDLLDHPLQTKTYSSDNSLLATTSATYTPFCKLSETDGEGITTQYTYDFSGRKIAEQTGAKVTHFTYNAAGFLETTDYQDYKETERYDEAGHLILKTIGSEGIQFRESYSYDEAGNCTHRNTSKGAFEVLYNSLGKPLAETNPMGYATHHTYDFDSDYRETTTDANRIKTLHIFDKQGREMETIKKNPQGEEIAKNECRYDQNGNLIGMTQSVFNGTELQKQITHQWDYGPLGRLERFLEAGEKQTIYLYDDKGRLQTLIKPSGIQFHHEWDALGRLIRYFSSDFDYRYNYDRNDRLLSVYDAISNTKTLRTYDALGAITKEIIGSGLTITNTFDEQGRRRKHILPDGSEISYAYNGAFLYSVTRKGQTFTYKARDLEGHPTKVELPSDLGTLEITRDPLSRIATFSSPFYHSLFPKEAYDPVGNLLRYHYEDSLGQVECNFTYDSLNQLVQENEHSYLFDSIHNRLQKDKAAHELNKLCQILNDGSTSYAYDPDGNLIFDGEWNYTYDTQDRLTALDNGVQRIEYTYDSFHRRLSKTVFTNGRRTKYERYLWDGDNEIGIVDEEGAIAELRVLGEGLGAEIGAAVLYELNGKTYVPLHDHRGCVVEIIDIETQQPLESYRYTAFGEQTNRGTLSPWRFSGKRVEEERGLLFFGRRYYLPTLGRWITQDPQGFDDGPNLYAYLHNCPLNCIDPYGLEGFDSSFGHFKTLGLSGLALDYFGVGKNRDFSGFEDNFYNKSRNFDGRHDFFEFDFPEAPLGGYFFGNGVGNEFEDLKEKAFAISSISGYNTKGTYNATHSLKVDAREALMNLVSHAKTPPVELYHQRWNDYFDNDRTGAPMWQGCHSQGTAHVRNALETYPKERRDRIVVGAFAPLGYISKELCMKVNHYVCPSDPITYFDFRGKSRCKETITFVKRMSNCKQSCHEFLNPIYQPYLKREIYNYQELLKNYER